MFKIIILGAALGGCASNDTKPTNTLLGARPLDGYGVEIAFTTGEETPPASEYPNAAPTGQSGLRWCIYRYAAELIQTQQRRWERKRQPSPPKSR